MSEGSIPFTSPHGQSTADYFIVYMSAKHLSSVVDMKVMHDAQYCNLSCDVPHDGQKSDHFPLQLDLACTIRNNKTNASRSSVQPSILGYVPARNVAKVLASKCIPTMFDSRVAYASCTFVIWYN